MSGIAVGVHDDLAAGEAGIALRAAHHELAGRVDQELGGALVEQLEIGVAGSTT